VIELEVDSIANVLEIAIDRHVTNYDAPYAYLAEKQNLKPVTGDNDVLKKGKTAIPIKDLK
jgi:predicted nucleic acid-binding protein